MHSVLLCHVDDNFPVQNLISSIKRNSFLYYAIHKTNIFDKRQLRITVKETLFFSTRDSYIHK